MVNLGLLVRRCEDHSPGSAMLPRLVPDAASSRCGLFLAVRAARRGHRRRLDPASGRFLCSPNVSDAKENWLPVSVRRRQTDRNAGYDIVHAAAFKRRKEGELYAIPMVSAAGSRPARQIAPVGLGLRGRNQRIRWTHMMCPGPCQARRSSMATATTPALFRVAASALAEHARKRPAEILGKRQRNRHATDGKNEQPQRKPSAERKAQAKALSQSQAGSYHGVPSSCRDEYRSTRIAPQAK
jgi:hypothetical protein